MKTKVGKLYEVIAKLDWVAKGSVVEVVIEGNHSQYVKLITGWYLHGKVGETFHINSQFIKPIEEKPMNTTNKFPDYSFKVSTELFNEEGLKAAYEWLKECAIEKGLTFKNLKYDQKRKYYFNLKSDHVELDEISDNGYTDMPKIRLNIETKTYVSGFTVKDNKEEKLKDIISRLERDLDEARNELANLETISERV